MSHDRFPSLAALKEQVGKDGYRIRCMDRKAAVTIISPHGGYIEAGTSAIARAVAGRRYNFFDFQGLQRERPWELHVTATRFRDPQLSDMLSRSRLAVSFHGMGVHHKPEIWLGGLHRRLKREVLEQLRQRDFDVNPDSPLYRGESPKNVVNLANEYGVQLELSSELLETLFRGAPFTDRGRCSKTTPRFDDIVEAVRAGISIYIRRSILTGGTGKRE